VGFTAGTVAAGAVAPTGGLAGAVAEADGAAATGAVGAGLVRAAFAAASFACDSALAVVCAVDSSSEAPLIFARTFTATSSGMELE
jgi:glycogen synthase